MCFNVSGITPQIWFCNLLFCLLVCFFKRGALPQLSCIFTCDFGAFKDIAIFRLFQNLRGSSQLFPNPHFCAWLECIFFPMCFASHSLRQIHMTTTSHWKVNMQLNSPPGGFYSFTVAGTERPCLPCAQWHGVFPTFSVWTSLDRLLVEKVALLSLCQEREGHCLRAKVWHSHLSLFLSSFPTRTGSVNSFLTQSQSQFFRNKFRVATKERDHHSKRSVWTWPTSLWTKRGCPWESTWRQNVFEFYSNSGADCAFSLLAGVRPTVLLVG